MEQNTVKKLKRLFNRHGLNVRVIPESDKLVHMCGGLTSVEWIIKGHTATCVNTSLDISSTFKDLFSAMKRAYKTRQESVVSDLLADETFIQYMKADNSGMTFSYLDIDYSLACLGYPAVQNSQARTIAYILNKQKEANR